MSAIAPTGPSEILDGLAVGESVVTKGQRSLQHGTPLKVLEGEGPLVARDGAGQAGESRKRGGQRAEGTSH